MLTNRHVTFVCWFYHLFNRFSSDNFYNYQTKYTKRFKWDYIKATNEVVSKTTFNYDSLLEKLYQIGVTLR